MPAAAIVAGSVISGAMAADAAGNAADQQSAAAGQSNATQRYMYDQTRSDQAPFRNLGVQANNQLGFLLGLAPRSGASNYATSGGITYDPNNPFANPAANAEVDRLAAQNGRDYAIQQVMAGWGASLNPIDPSIEQNRLAEASQDPMFGSLLRKFGQEDLNNDVVYQSGRQFGLDQGTQGINRQAAAGGNLLSGATLKALSRFGNDYGSTKANESYNRFNNDQNSLYNRLAGVSGAGQQATNQVGAAGQNYANQVSNTQTALGNARGASSIAQGNAWGNALSSGYNAYQQNNLLNALQQQNTGYNVNGAMSGQF